MSLLRIKELEAQLARRDKHIQDLELKIAASEIIAGTPAYRVLQCTHDGSFMSGGLPMWDKAPFVDPWIDAGMAKEVLLYTRPVKFLKDGMRFKITGSDRFGAELLGMPQDLIGSWVAFVDATDNKHMDYAPSTKANG